MNCLCSASPETPGTECGDWVGTYATGIEEERDSMVSECECGGACSRPAARRDVPASSAALRGASQRQRGRASVSVLFSCPWGSATSPKVDNTILKSLQKVARAA